MSGARIEVGNSHLPVTYLKNITMDAILHSSEAQQKWQLRGRQVQLLDSKASKGKWSGSPKPALLKLLMPYEWCGPVHGLNRAPCIRIRTLSNSLVTQRQPGACAARLGLHTTCSLPLVGSRSRPHAKSAIYLSSGAPQGSRNWAVGKQLALLPPNCICGDPSGLDDMTL